jgi:hypothetical protein
MNTWASRLLAIATLVAFATFVAGAAIAKPKPVPSGNGWSAATAISGINQPDPTRGSQLNDVAVNANGLTIAAWDQFTYATGGPYTIGAAVQSGGRWGAPFTISGTTGFSLTPRVAVGADGTMAVSWTFQDPAIPNRQSVQVAVKPPSSATWTTTTLATFTTGGVAITRPSPVAIDAAGNVTAVWNVWDGTRNVVQTATLPKGGSWSSATQLSGTGTDALYLSLAVNARGDTAVAYTLSPYSSYLSGTWAEYVFRSGPSGAWTAPVKVSETISSSVGYVTNPQVALDANGLATIIYMGSGLEAARQLSSGSWTTGATVIPSPMFGASFLSPDLGIDGSGNAVVAVAIFDPTIGVDRSSVWVTRGTPEGSWSPALRITDPTVPVDAYATRVAVSPDGMLAMVGWIDHYHGTVQVSQLVNGAWGPANTIGRGTASWSSAQEVLGLDAGSGTVARAIWKNAKTGTQTMAASYG